MGNGVICYVEAEVPAPISFRVMISPAASPAAPGAEPSSPAWASSGSSVFPAVLPCKPGTWGRNPYKLVLSCCTHGGRPGGTCERQEFVAWNAQCLRPSPSVLSSSAAFNKTFSSTIKTSSLRSL